MDAQPAQEKISFDITPMTNAKCSLLIHGYTRLFYKSRSVPSEIARLCVSFYSIWFDLKIVYCDDETGQIDLKNYIIEPIPLYSNLTLQHIADKLEENMYAEAVTKEYDRLCKIPQDAPSINASTYEKLINGAMTNKFGSGLKTVWKNKKLEKMCWTMRNPLVHVWLRFKHIKIIYPITTEMITLDKQLYDNEDNDRWVEVPDDYTNVSLSKIKRLDPNFDHLVIERCNVIDWVEGTGTWPRAKGDDWRETIKIGDIVEVRDEYGDFESMIRYIYPKDHETMSKKCVIHYIGWLTNCDEVLDFDSDRIMKRYTNCNGPHRRKQEVAQQSQSEQTQRIILTPSQEDADLQRAIAASLEQI